jgi:hypothetical protein
MKSEEIFAEAHGPYCGFVKVQLRWSESEPLLVEVDFIHPGGEVVTWEVGREFMVDSLGEVAVHGQGDVQIVNMGGINFLLTLFPENEDLEADVTLPAQPVRDFLEATLEALPLGEEGMEEEIDEFLSSLLG